MVYYIKKCPKCKCTLDYSSNSWKGVGRAVIKCPRCGSLIKTGMELYKYKSDINKIKWNIKNYIQMIFLATLFSMLTWIFTYGKMGNKLIELLLIFIVFLGITLVYYFRMKYVKNLKLSDIEYEDTGMQMHELTYYLEKFKNNKVIKDELEKELNEVVKKIEKEAEESERQKELIKEMKIKCPECGSIHLTVKQEENIVECNACNNSFYLNVILKNQKNPEDN